VEKFREWRLMDTGKSSLSKRLKNSRIKLNGLQLVLQRTSIINQPDDCQLCITPWRRRLVSNRLEMSHHLSVERVYFDVSCSQEGVCAAQSSETIRVVLSDWLDKCRTDVATR